MKTLLIGILGSFSSTVFACGPESTMLQEAVRQTFADPDIVRYVCLDSDCTIEEFSEKIDIKAVALNSKGTAGIQIEPLLKGKQYFSAIFLKDQCKYRMVFAPDITLSSVRLIKKQKNNFYVVRAVERDSVGAWKEYDFAYDAAVKQYSEPEMRCFRTSGGKNVVVKCE